MQRKRQMWPEKPPSSLDQSSVKAETKWKPVLKSEQFLISWTPQKRTEVIRLSISALWCYLVKIHQCWKVHTDFRETCSPIQNTSVTGKLHIHQEDAKPHSPAWPPPRRIQLLRWPAYNPDLSPSESIWLMRQKLQQRCCRTAEQLELSIRQQQDKTSLLVLLPSNSKMNFVFSVFIFDYWSNLTLQHLKIIAFSFSLPENSSFVGIGVVWTEVQMNIKKYTNSFYWADIHSLILILGRRHTVTSAIWISFDDQPQKKNPLWCHPRSSKRPYLDQRVAHLGATVRQRYLFPGNMKI